MLQRTKATQAERAFLEFRKRYPCPEDLCNAGLQGARWLTEQLGLHWRGPLLLKAAEEVVKLGGVPDDLEGLLGLPGVGPYAAAASLSLHQGRRAVIVDNNVARWLARLTGRPYHAETRRARWVRDLAEELTPRRMFREFNYAILDFTMQICRPRRPRCDECPLRRDCRFVSCAPRLSAKESPVS